MYIKIKLVVLKVNFSHIGQSLWIYILHLGLKMLVFVPILNTNWQYICTYMYIHVYSTGYEYIHWWCTFTDNMEQCIVRALIETYRLNQSLNQVTHQLTL